MCVVGHGNGWMDGAEMKVMIGKHAVQIQEALVACREMPEHLPSVRLHTDDTRLNRRPGAQLLVESSRNWLVFLERPKHGTPRESSGSLSMQPAGYNA